MLKNISIFIPSFGNDKKEIKTQILTIKRQLQTVPKDDYVYEGEFSNYKINGKGNLFYKGDLKYKGEWKNGEINGAGTLYYDGSDVMMKKGYFKNGLLHGYGIEYNEEGKKDSEGMFKNGFLQGKGFIYNPLTEEDIVLSEGEFKKGVLDGKGKVFWSDGTLSHNGTFLEGDLIFGKVYDEDGQLIEEGGFKNNRLNGKGTRYKNGNKYQVGHFKNGNFTGEGTVYFENGKKHMEGSFKNGMLEGEGKSYNRITNNLILQGRFKKSKLHGRGIEYEYDTSDIVYEGMWKEGIYYGKGTEYYADGGYCTAHFVNGEKKGKGKKYTKQNVLVYDGLFDKDLMNGYGNLFYLNGDIKYRGNFKNGKFNGKGKYHEFYGCYEIGNFLNGERHGKMKEYSDSTHQLLSSVSWKNGIKDGIGIFYYSNGKIKSKFHYKNDVKNGYGIEYREDGSILRKGTWEDGDFISEDNRRERKTVNKVQMFKKENKIRKFLQDSNLQHLETIKPKEIKAYLKKYSGKEVTGSRDKLIKELRKWKQQLNRQRVVEGDEPMVFDAYEGGDIPISEFLQEEDRVLLISESGHYFGAYLTQCDVIYECESGRAFYDYVGNPDVHAMIRFPTASASKFYFDIDIDNDMKNGYNVFHFKTNPKDLKVLSKDVAEGGTFVGGLHCDPKDIIKLSTVTKKEKKEGGLKKTVDFEF